MGHRHPGPRLIGALLRVPSNAFMREINAGLTSRFPDLRFTHLPVYQHIDHPPGGTRLTTLAERAQLTKQAMIEAIDDMEQKRFVERVPDPGDRRAKLIRLTERGMDVHESATQVGLLIQERWADGLGTARFDALLDLLRELNELVDADPRHG
jgi:DNA-binding MarR family transcriptional regulator